MSISGSVFYTSTISFNPNFDINLYIAGGIGFGNNPVGTVECRRVLAPDAYLGTVNNGADLYITAGQTLSIVFNFETPAGFYQVGTFGHLRGYLISN